MGPVQIHAASRPKADPTADPRRWTVEADDYDQGMELVRIDVPDDWQLLYVRVDR